MQFISKENAIKEIKSGSKLNDAIRVLTKDIMEKVTKETVIDIKEEIMRCRVCGRQCIPTRNDAEDVWLMDEEGLICARCELERRNHDQSGKDEEDDQRGLGKVAL